MPMPDGERIARVEQQVVDLSQKVTEGFSTLNKEVHEIKGMVQAKYAEHPVFDQKFLDLANTIKDLRTDLNREIMVVKTELNEIKTSSNIWKWLAPTLTAVFTAVVTFLVIRFLESGGMVTGAMP